MISLRSVGKVVGKFGTRRQVLDRVSAVFESSEHYVVLGLRGSGKSTLLRIMAGMTQPTTGVVTRRCSVSLPSGYGPGIGAGKTAREVIRLMANLYEADPQEVLDFTTRFSRLEHVLHFPFASLPPTLRSRLCYALLYAVPAEVLLFDDAVAYGDPDFRRQCYRALENRRKTSGTIVATRDSRRASDLAERAAILHRGQLVTYATVDEAVQHYEHLQIEDAQAGVAYAEALVKRGEVAKAQEYMKRHLLENEGTSEVTGEAYELLADLSVRLGYHEDAQAALRTALDHLPDSPGPLLLFARIAEREGRHHEVIDYAEKVLELSPGHRAAQALLAKSYEGLRMNDEAARIWLSIAMESDDQLSLRLAIRNFVKAGDWSGVATAIDSVARPQVLDVRMLELKAKACIELGRWSDAVAAMTSLLDKDPEKAISLLERLAKTPHWLKAVEFLGGADHAKVTALAASRRISSLIAIFEKQLIMQLAEGRMEEAEQLTRAISFINPNSTLESSEGNLELHTKASPSGRKPDLSSAEGIVQELYELRLNRSQIEASSYADRNKAAWTAAKAFVAKFDKSRGE